MKARLRTSSEFQRTLPGVANDLAKLHAALDAVEEEIDATDLETSEALQADLVIRIRAAIRYALGEDQ